MKFAEKEVEHLEQKVREEAGLPTEPGDDGKPVPPIELPEISIMREQIRRSTRKETELERQKLEEKVSEVEVQIKEVQEKLKALNKPDYESATLARESFQRRLETAASEKENVSRNSESIEKINEEASVAAAEVSQSNEKGAPGPDGDFVEFPPYDGSEPPKECRKAFTHFCMHTRKEVKASLDLSERKDKVRKWQCLIYLFLDFELRKHGEAELQSFMTLGDCAWKT